MRPSRPFVDRIHRHVRKESHEPDSMRQKQDQVKPVNESGTGSMNTYGNWAEQSGVDGRYVARSNFRPRSPHTFLMVAAPTDMAT